jgi:threonine/homoserine/homoserine lactone efflux protein
MFLIIELAILKKIREIGWFLVGTYLVDLVAFLIILFGFGKFLQNRLVLIGIGLMGGFVLTVLGIQIFLASRRLKMNNEVRGKLTEGYVSHPLWSGLLVAGTNPLYWVWWSTIGVNFTAQSLVAGTWASWVMFLILIISTGIGSVVIVYIIYKSADWLQTRAYFWMVRFCCVGLIFFGGYFIVTSVFSWLG